MSRRDSEICKFYSSHHSAATTDVYYLLRIKLDLLGGRGARVHL